MMYNSADNDFVAKVMAALKEQHVQSILHVINVTTLSRQLTPGIFLKQNN